MASRRSSGPGFWSYTLVGCLAVAVGALALWVARDLRTDTPQPGRGAKTPASRSESAVRRLLGPLDVSGSRLSVRDRREALGLRDQVRSLVRENPEKLEIVEEQEGAGSLRLTLRVGSDVYPVEVRWEGAAAPSPPGTPGTRVAFVIDDFGRDVAEARAFLDLEIVVTPAVIPHLAHSLEVAHLARERGRDFLLHLPMEPQGYPKVDPGRGALLRGMSEAEIRTAVGQALSSVPGAAGVNNHMGSRLTELPEPMGWVMEELRARGLFFLDSSTSARSVAADSARTAGLGWVRRDVFLDNEQTVEAVGRQIALTLQKAGRSGSAVAIGHPHRATLEALKLWTPRMKEAGVQVVPLTQLVRRPEG